MDLVIPSARLAATTTEHAMPPFLEAESLKADKTKGKKRSLIIASSGINANGGY